MKWVAVFLGGGLGSLLRFALSSWLAPVTSLFPWATLAANALAAVTIALDEGRSHSCCMGKHSTQSFAEYRFVLLYH